MTSLVAIVLATAGCTRSDTQEARSQAVLAADDGGSQVLVASPGVVLPGGVATVAVNGGPGNTNDWVGLYLAGDVDANPLTWRYLNGSMTPPAMGVSAATLSFPMPTNPGAYEFRFFLNETFTRIAVSNGVTVAPLGTDLGGAADLGGASDMNAPGDMNPRDMGGAGDMNPPPDQGLPSDMNVPADLGTSTPDGGGLMLSASPAAPLPGGTVAATLSGGPGNLTDWVGLYRIGAPDTEPTDWQYLSGTRTPPSMRLTAATLSFTLPTAPGTFEFRFFVNDTFTRLATSNTFTASAPQAMLSAFPSANMPGGAETVSVSGGPGNLTDWVGLYRPGDLDVNPIDWQYLSGTRTPPAAGLRSATLTFTMPATAGIYEFRFFQNDSYSRLATSGSVTVGVVPTVTVTPATIGPQGTITVTVTGGPGNPTDWLGLAAQGSDERILLDWEYLNGTRTAPATGVTTATLTFIAPSAPGTYVVKLYANDSFSRVATSNPFQVQ